MTKHDQCVVGVDLGGTKILTAIFDSALQKRAQTKKKTNPSDGEDSIIETICETITDALKKADQSPESLSAIGVTVPGVFDRNTGVVFSTPNLPFSDYPLKQKLEMHFPVPVVIENDVNAGTYGEYRAGAAKGFTHVIGVFPGTGIGGGLILDGKLFIGATGNAGEVGHMIINPSGPLCGCGKYGCLEAHASRSAMSRDAVFLANSGAAPETLASVGTDYAKYTSKVYDRACNGGDATVAAIVDRAAWYLGIGIANCVNLLSPEVVVIGGGLVERLGRHYLDRVEHSMREHAMSGISESVRMIAATLGDDAAVYGAAALANERLTGVPRDG